MSIHLNDDKSLFAKVVIMPGDPNRAEWIAKNFLNDVILVKNERKNDAYTGYTPNGVRVTVIASGMGIPSIGIYVTELFQEYDVETIIRIGTCGLYQKETKLGDIILPSLVLTNSNWASQYGLDPSKYFPLPDEKLLSKAIEIAKHRSLSYKVGEIYTSDVFYDTNEEAWKKWQSLGVLGVEMETYGLYAIADKLNKKAIAILNGTDHFVTKQIMPKEDRVNKLVDSISLAIGIIDSLYASK